MSVIKLNACSLQQKKTLPEKKQILFFHCFNYKVTDFTKNMATLRENPAKS